MTKIRQITNEFRKELLEQLLNHADLDWDSFLEISAKAKLWADREGVNTAKVPKSLVEIISDVEKAEKRLGY